jgi:hypothetical protein
VPTKSRATINTIHGRSGGSGNGKNKGIIFRLYNTRLNANFPILSFFLTSARSIVIDRYCQRNSKYSVSVSHDAKDKFSRYIKEQQQHKREKYRVPERNDR